MRHHTTALETNARDGDLGRAGKGVGRIRDAFLSWGLKSLIPMGVFGLAWLSSDEPSGETARMRLACGKPGVMMRCFAFAPNSKTVATVDFRGKVALRDLQVGRGIERFLDGQGRVRCVAFSPDGRFLAMGRVEPDLVVFDLVSGGARRLRNPSLRRIQALTFSPDGRTVAATTDQNGNILLWDLDGDRVRDLPRPLSGLVSCVLARRPHPRCGRTRGATGHSLGSRNGLQSVVSEEATRLDLLDRVLARRQAAGRRQFDGAHGPDLGPEDRSVVPSDRGASPRHQLSRFFPGRSNPGHRRQ